MEGEDKVSARRKKSRNDGQTELFVGFQLPLALFLWMSLTTNAWTRRILQFVYLCILLINSAPTVSVNLVRKQVQPTFQPQHSVMVAVIPFLWLLMSPTRLELALIHSEHQAAWRLLWSHTFTVGGATQSAGQLIWVDAGWASGMQKKNDRTAKVGMFQRPPAETCWPLLRLPGIPHAAAWSKCMTPTERFWLDREHEGVTWSLSASVSLL